MTIHFSSLFQLSPPSVLHGTAPERVRSWLAAVTTVMVLPPLFAMSSGCCQNDIRRIPTIRGRVVEAKTDRPISGARLARWFEREDGCLAPGGSDVHPVAGSFVTVTSAKDGSFEWPAWTGLVSPIKTMRWYIYHPNWVAEEGWFNHPRRGLDGYFFGIAGVQPWIHLDSYPVGSHLEVTLRMEPKDSTAAWEAHFQRLETLTRYGRLDIDYFMKEAVGYAEKNEPTEKMIEELDRVQNHTGYIDENGKHAKVREGLVLLGLERAYCKKHPDSGFCRRAQADLDWRLRFLTEAAAKR